MISTPHSKTGYSEEEMAEVFLRQIKSSSGLKGLGKFDSIYREVDCLQGRPDFIALKTNDCPTAELLPPSLGIVGPFIISLLKPQSPRTLSYILKKSEFTEDSIKRTLRKLVSSNYVKQTKTGSYTLMAQTKISRIEVWAFELKLNNPKRAIFQAQQYCTFADNSMIIIPPDQAKNYIKFKSTMDRWGIGLAEFDIYTGRFSISTRPKKSPPLSRQHQLYTLSQLSK